tara:strand:+ start:407 stop:538 length:132 start_codon:yes stop_codon:yes gene_type:complete
MTPTYEVFQNELLKDPFYEFHEKRIREDIEREGDLDKLYEGLE